MEPFGRAMTTALESARFDPASEEAVWIEEDVDGAAGWRRIDDLSGLWARALDRSER